MASIASSPASLLLAVLLCAGAASAELLPPERFAELPRELRSSRPTLLLPIFARCGGTCPMTAVRLKHALASAEVPFRVVLLSFDERDTDRDLREFADRFSLPAEWTLLPSVDARATRAFLDALDFHVMAVEGGFDHPNETFVFSPAGRWAATFTGLDFTPADLRTAHGRALAADEPSAAGSVAAWLLRPDAWILLACAGLCAALLGVAIGRRLGHRPE